MAATRLFSVTPTITAGAYSANDVVGGMLTFGETINGQATFGGLNRSGAAGTIRRLTIVDDDNEKAACKLYLFNVLPTAIADNAAFAPTIDDLKNLIAVIVVAAADYTTINANAVAFKDDLGISFQITTDGALFGYLVCDATPTYTAITDLTLKLTVWDN